MEYHAVDIGPELQQPDDANDQLRSVADAERCGQLSPPDDDSQFPAASQTTGQARR